MQERERWNAEQLNRWQDDRLRGLFLECARNVPYYVDLFRREGLDPNVMHPRVLLSRIPFLGKPEVRDDPEKFLNRSARQWLLRKAHTSGTTGTPLVCYRDLFSINYEHAMIWRQWRWCGFDFGDRRATLRGDLVVPTTQREPPFWKFNPAEKQLVMSSYHLGPATSESYLDALAAFRPKAIEGYPSAVALVARAFEDSGRAPFPLRGVFTSSETLLEHQRECIERVFQCRVMDLYGNTERTAAIGTCEHGAYHVFSDYGIVEFAGLPSGEKEIVGTSLFNRVFPLLRYRSGDVAVPGGEACPCGRVFPTVASIEGRVESYVWTPEGNAVGRLDHIFKGTSNIIESQIVQGSPGAVVIRIVPAPGFSAQDESLVLRNARERLGPTMALSVERVGKIERTPQGKFLAVVSKLPDGGARRPDSHIDNNQRHMP
jgi:phenylacetate-CoA ligase